MLFLCVVTTENLVSCLVPMGTPFSLVSLHPARSPFPPYQQKTRTEGALEGGGLWHQASLNEGNESHPGTDPPVPDTRAAEETGTALP